VCVLCVCVMCVCVCVCRRTTDVYSQAYLERDIALLSKYRGGFMHITGCQVYTSILALNTGRCDNKVRNNCLLS